MEAPMTGIMFDEITVRLDGDCVCVKETPNGDTVYLTPAQCRAVAKILPQFADMIDAQQQGEM